MSRQGCRGFSAFATPWAGTYPGKLKEHAYHFGHVGKWHNGTFPAKKLDFASAHHGKLWYHIEDDNQVHVTKRNESDALEFLRERPQDQPFCLTVACFAPHAEDTNPKQFLPQPESIWQYSDVAIPVPLNANDASWKRPPAFFDENNEGLNRWR